MDIQPFATHFWMKTSQFLDTLSFSRVDQKDLLAQPVVQMMWADIMFYLTIEAQFIIHIGCGIHKFLFINNQLTKTIQINIRILHHTCINWAATCKLQLFTVLFPLFQLQKRLFSLLKTASFFLISLSPLSIPPFSLWYCRQARQPIEKQQTIC